MKQWYRLSPRECYRIASIKDSYIPPVKYAASLVFEKCNSIEDFSSDIFSNDSCIPYKSKEYVKRRYFDHPIYKYLVYKVLINNSKTSSIVVLRKEKVKDLCALRLIDFIGNYENLTYLTSQLDSIAKQNNAEYIDMYEFGLSDTILKKAGWICVENSDNIIPNYFSPFEKRNIDIYICTTNEKVVLFKGDGDQDRPN